MANLNTQRISSFFGKELIYGSYLSKFLPILVGLLLFFQKNNIDKILWENIGNKIEFKLSVITECNDIKHNKETEINGEVK